MSYQWANNLLYQLTGTQPPAQREGGPRGENAEGRGRSSRDGQRTRGERPIASDFKSIGELLAIAKSQDPQWKSISFRTPGPHDRTVTLSLDGGDGGQPQRRSQLTVNRSSGGILRNEQFATYNLGRKLRTIARFLHTGEILGVGGQIIAAIASLGGAVLVWTGLALGFRRLAAWLKRRNREIRATAKAEAVLTE